MRDIQGDNVNILYKEVDGSSITKKPFPHIIIEDFFTDVQLVEKAGREISEESEINSNIGMNGRRRFMKAAYESDSANPGPNLSQFMDIVRSDEFAINLLNGFREHILDHLGIEDEDYDLEKMYKENYYLDYDISIGDNGYSREVHRDTDERLLVILFSFNDSNHDGGEICFYHTNEDSNKAQQYPTNVKKVITEDHKKNKAVIFLSNRVSYHSVNEISNCFIPRKFIYAAITKGQPPKPKPKPTPKKKPVKKKQRMKTRRKYAR